MSNLFHLFSVKNVDPSINEEVAKPMVANKEIEPTDKQLPKKLPAMTEDEAATIVQACVRSHLTRRSLSKA